MDVLENEVRDFVRAGAVNAPVVADMVPALERGLRRHRRRKIAVAGVGVVAALGIAGTVVRATSDSTDKAATDELAADSGQSGIVSDCSQTAITSAGVSTAQDPASGARQVAVVLRNGGSSGVCVVGAQTAVQLGESILDAGAQVPADVTPVNLRSNEEALLVVDWTNWCGAQSPQIVVMFADSHVAKVSVPQGSEYPTCTDATKPTRVAEVRVSPTTGQAGGVQSD